MFLEVMCIRNPYTQFSVDKLLCLIEEEQMVFAACQYQSVPTSQLDLWCFTGQRWANEWETEREREMGRAGALSVNIVQWHHQPKSADVCVWKRIWVLVDSVWGSKVLNFACLCC